MFEWFFVSSLQFVIFGSVKNDVLKKTLPDTAMDDTGSRQ